MIPRRRERQPPLPNGLYVGLVITADAVANGDKIKVFRTKGVMMFFRHGHESFGQVVVELFLGDGVVLGGVVQVVVAVFD